MSNEIKSLIEQVRALPPEDRIALVEKVLDSLDPAESSIDALWAGEARERAAAYERGEIPSRTLSEIVTKYRP